MRLRTLKKWSKQAAPILVEHYGMKPFLAERGESYHGLKIRCSHKQNPQQYCRCECQYHPLSGTPMVGWMDGYYEPEWTERTAWEHLREHVLWGDRPRGMSEEAWAAATRLVRITQADHDALDAHINELQAIA